MRRQEFPIYSFRGRALVRSLAPRATKSQDGQDLHPENASFILGE
jgi:hypothetical protein